MITGRRQTMKRGPWDFPQHSHVALWSVDPKSFVAGAWGIVSEQHAVVLLLGSGYIFVFPISSTDDVENWFR